MSKNLTLKGAAFGALVALSVASVAPANAVVNDSAVSLVPSTGTQYSIVQDNVFDLKSDQSLAAVAGSGNLKFLVTDPSKVTVFDWAEGSPTNDSLLSIANVSSGTAATVAVASNVVTIADSDNPYGSLAAGDVVTITGLDSSGWGDAYTGTVELASAAAGSITFKLTHADLSSENTSAGAILELTDADALDTRADLAVVDAATLPTAGVTSLTQPTRATDGSYVVNTGASSAATTDTLRLISKAASGTSATATVTAWIDENGDGDIDSTEDSSSTRTVTFVPWASSGVALTLDQPVAAGTTWKGTVAFDSSINASQITDNRIRVGLGFVIDGAIVDAADTTTVSSGAFTAGNYTQYNSTNNNWEIEDGSGTVGEAVSYNWASGTDNEFRAGYTYAAQIVLDGSVYGSVAYKAISTALADAVGNVGATRGANVSYNGSTAVTVRSGTKSVELSAKVTKSSVAVANAPVTVTVTRSTLDADSTVTVNGKSFTSTSASADASISYAATTAADGTVKVSVANSQGKANDAVTVKVVHAGISSGDTTVTWSDVTATGYKIDEASNISNSIVNIAKAGSYNLNWKIADNFGSAPVDTFRVKAVYTFLGSSQTANTKYVAVSAGAATLAITDASTANGSYNVVATLQKLNTTSGNYETVQDSGSADIAVTTAVHVGAASTPATITLDITEDTDGTAGAIDLEPADFETADRRVNANQAANAYDSSEDFEISGLVTDASGVAVPGAVVTIKSDAGNAVSFVVDGVVTVGSATVVASASGQYTGVSAYSHKAGDIKFTATSGAATKTADAVQARNATTAAAVVGATIGLVEKLTPGYTTTVKISVLDKWGNAVKQANGLTVAVSGLGYGASLPTAVSSTDGTASFTLITLPGERGIATVTVVAAADTASTDDVTVSKSVLVGVSAKITKPAKGATATVKYAAGATIKLVRGTKSVTKVATSASQKVTLKSGTGKVSVYVNGVKVASK